MKHILFAMVLCCALFAPSASFASPVFNEPALVPHSITAVKQNPAPTIAPLRFSVVYDFKAKTFTPAAGTKIAGIENFLGTRNELELWFPLVGMSLSRGQMSYGGALVYPFAVGENARILVGVAGKLEAEKVRAGLVLGLEIRG